MSIPDSERQALSGFGSIMAIGGEFVGSLASFR